MRRRIFVATAERVDTSQLEMEFAAKLAELDKLGGVPSKDADDGNEGDDARKKKRKKTTPTGRRDLMALDLEEDRVEILDPLFEELVACGKAERAGFETSAKLGYKRGGLRRVVCARAKYRVLDAQRRDPTSRRRRCRPSASRARWPRPRFSQRSSPTSTATGCRSTASRTGSLATARASTAAPCVGGSRTRGRPRGRRSSQRRARRRSRRRSAWPPTRRASRCSPSRRTRRGASLAAAGTTSCSSPM